MPSRHIRVVVAAIATAAAAFSNSAQAQPTCAVGTLAGYVALAGGCQFGGLAFTDFQGTFSGVSRSLGGVTLTPVSGGGQAGFGLALSPALAVSVTDGDVANQLLDVTFSVAGVGTGGTLGFAPISLFTSFVDVGGLATGLTEAFVALEVQSGPDGAIVRGASSKTGGLPGMFGCAVDVSLVPCGPFVGTDFAGGQVHLRGVVNATATQGASATASLPNLSVLVGVGAAPPPPALVTPEPAPAFLLGGGIGALALLGARRRRRDRAPGRRLPSGAA